MKRVGDIMNFLSIFRFIWQTLDLWTDLSFSFVLYLSISEDDNNNNNNIYILFLLSLTFTVLPYILSCIICVYFLIIWNKWKYDHPYRLKNYLSSYELIIIFLTLFGGFYCTIDLLRSKLFYIRATYFPLKINEYNSLQYLRFVNFILLENIPQFIIQLMYLFQSNESIQLLPIVFIALFMTVVGLLFGILKICKRSIEEECQCIRFKCPGINDNSTDSTPIRWERRHDHNVHTKINCHFVIQCKKARFKSGNAFCHKKMSKSLKMVLNTCHDKRYWHGKNNVYYDIECYHIESQHHLNRLTVYFELNLYTKFNEDGNDKDLRLNKVTSVSGTREVSTTGAKSDSKSGHTRTITMDLFDTDNEDESRHEKIVTKLKENLKNMFDLKTGSDIANDCEAAFGKLFRLRKAAKLEITFDPETDITVSTAAKYHHNENDR